MLKKKTQSRFIFKILLLLLFINQNSIGLSEIILFTNCDNGLDGFKKNEYILDLEKSLVTRNFIYDTKTYKKYRITDITTKKKNSVSRFIYIENNQILSDKIGYPQFYTQLIFEKNNKNIKIKTVINNMPTIAIFSKCEKI